MPTTPTPEQIQYMQEHIDDTLVPSMHISNGIMAGVATISVVMRFMARRMNASGIGKDDICLFVAYMLFVVYSAGLSYTSRFGEGKHILHLTNLRGFAIYCSSMLEFSQLGGFGIHYGQSV
ncbi:hypothetical protein BOTCAL_0351g00120 [Botryotinia calthae]|uniref:Uncharacterized protein n=1 Tax=Botryotinia calthae TaxID=38488 RepID=A0A4Y8CSH0_9HELO|nr:hypothetical protein BOTCAL_0351g00120 [Botryotinia calthae]